MGRSRFIIPSLIGAALFLYVVIRAWLLSFTHDEGLTFMHFMYAPIKDVITYSYANANNHVLNTLLMRLMAAILPLKDHWLRLPNVLCYLLYLVFSWRIVSDFDKKYWRIAAWLFLNSIPYLLDFFSLMRGYGLSFGFMMTSLYFLKIYLANPRYRTLIFCLIPAGLAVLSSMVLLNYFLALTAVLFLQTLLCKKPVRFKWRTLEIYFAVAIPLLAYALYVSFRLRAEKELFFGSTDGFWMGTVKSLVTRILYLETAEEGDRIYVGGVPFLIFSIFIIAVLCTAAYLFFRKWRHGIKAINFSQALFLLLILCAASIIAQYYLLGTLLVIDRTALFLVPIFLLLIIFIFREMWTHQAARVVFATIILISGINFFLHANFTHCLEWNYDANTEHMMHDLRAYNQTKHDNKVRWLHTYWTYHPASAFYQNTDDYSFLRPIDRIYRADFSFDYFYLPQHEMRRMKGHPVRVIKTYPLTHTVLLENLKPVKRKTFSEGRLSFTAQDSLLPNIRYAAAQNHHGKQSVEIKGGDFGPYFPISVKGLPKNIPLRIEVQAEIWCARKPVGDIAVSILTPKDSQYHWNARLIEQAAIPPGWWYRVTYNENLPAFVTDDDIIRVYLWNTGTETIYLSELKAAIAVRPNE